MIFRYRIVLLVIIAFFALILLRLFYWQVVKAEELSEMGQKQYGRSTTVMPQRGEIMTSDSFPIAANKISYTVYVNPKQVKDKKEFSDRLSLASGIDNASISANLNLDLFWVSLAKNIDIQTKEKIEELKLPGVGFEENYSRYYPEGSISAHLLGFVGKDEAGEDKGYFGLEGYYDRLLRGKVGKAIFVHDAFGRPVVSEISKVSDKVDGSDLVLNIDRAVQFLAEKRLKEGVEKYSADSGMVGIMNPETGAIIAMASYPAFDPLTFKDFTEKDFKNPFITDLYEPGSTFKPLIMSSALDANLVEPETKCDICSGPVSVGGYALHTWDDKYRANISMIDVIRHSDNTGMVFVGKKLGLDRFLSYISRFGIGKLTGIDLQGEVYPEIKTKENWYEVDLATASFGQGIQVTAMELLSAVSAIANDGKRMEPQIVKEIVAPNGKVTKVKPKELGEPIKAETSKVMTEFMVNAVNKGEAQWTRLKNYRVAGKTGTASIPIKGHYDPNHTIASFVGFAPADDPKFIMLVVLNRPKTSIYGAETAAPLFFSIAKDLVSYYGISPSE